MNISSENIKHADTHSFSNLVINYIQKNPDLNAFYAYENNLDGLKQAIEDRKDKPIDRKLLVNVVKEQYAGVKMAQKVQQNLESLLNQNTFSICAAHQPNLMTGHLYFFYKIIQSVVLSNYCKIHFPEYYFVPVFYIGSEDNDIEELCHFYYDGKTYYWDTKQTGAVGKMLTTNMSEILTDFFKVLGPPGEFADQLKDIINSAYNGQHTVAQAKRIIINALLGEYGVICIDGDHPKLKATFTDIVKDDLWHHHAFNFVQKTSDRLIESYKAQAFVRPINLFYLKDQIRERITYHKGQWQVLKTDISWDEKTLLKEIEVHPERFSPNVILRGLYQERILPNIAFIGGGSEIAYWMQLKSLFEHYGIFFPMLVLRQSILWMEPESVALQEKLQLSYEALFRDADFLLKQKVISEHKDLMLQDQIEAIKRLFQPVKMKAESLDSTLVSSTEATMKKIENLMDGLSRKMIRASKRNEQIFASRLYKLREYIFPEGTLQERQQNFTTYFVKYGPDYFTTLFDHIQPFGTSFTIIKVMPEKTS